MIPAPAVRARVNSQHPQTPFTLGQAWLIALSGVALGAVFNELGARLAGGGLAILGFAPLFLYWDQRLLPGLTSNWPL